MSTNILAAAPASLAAQLEALNQEHNASELHANKQTVNIQTTEVQFQRDQQVQAEQRAQEAADDEAFWGDVVDVAKDVAAVAAIAGAAFTGGSTLVVAAAIIGGGLTLGGDVAGRLGADKKVCTGLEIAGAALSLVSGGASLLIGGAQEVSEAAAIGGVASKSVSGGATVVQGGAHVEQGVSAKAETDSNADSVASGARADDAKNLVDNAFTRMQQEQSNSRLRTRVAASLEELDQQVVSTLTNAIRG
jgi:hypothetical protein